MNTRKITAELRLSNWTNVLRERAESGLSIKAYCEKEGIHENSYYYWQKKIRETVGNHMMNLKTGSIQGNLTKPSFMEVSIPEMTYQTTSLGSGGQSGEIKIEINVARINANSEYPVDKLMRLLKGLVRV